MAKKNRIPHPLIAQAKREIQAATLSPRTDAIRPDRSAAYNHQPAGYSERLQHQLRNRLAERRLPGERFTS